MIRNKRAGVREAKGRERSERRNDKESINGHNELGVARRRGLLSLILSLLLRLQLVQIRAAHEMVRHAIERRLSACLAMRAVEVIFIQMNLQDMPRQVRRVVRPRFLVIGTLEGSVARGDVSLEVFDLDDGTVVGADAGGFYVGNGLLGVVEVVLGFDEFEVVDEFRLNWDGAWLVADDAGSVGEREWEEEGMDECWAYVLDGFTVGALGAVKSGTRGLVDHELALVDLQTR